MKEFILSGEALAEKIVRKNGMIPCSSDHGFQADKILNKGRYGSPRIHQQLYDEGIHVGRKQVIRLMKQEQLAAHHTTHRVVTTHADPAAMPAANVLDRAFEAERPNEKWVADVTSIATGAGWLYLAAVMDLFSRRIVGWALAATQDEALVEQALSMAVTHRKPEAGLLHHSDRGCQYTSQAYQAFLKNHDIRVSMSREGHCWDNAVIERFFGTRHSGMHLAVAPGDS